MKSWLSFSVYNKFTDMKIKQFIFNISYLTLNNDNNLVAL